jgi:predicted HTH domain antitoxin
MSVQMTIELPEGAFAVLRSTPDVFVNEMRLAAAVKWYDMGVVSQGKAAELAGLSRAAFIYNLARFNASPFQVTAQELAEEMARE